MGGVLAAPCARAQKSLKRPVLGSLTPHPAPKQQSDGPILAHLRKLGWVNGENIEIFRPDAEGREDRLPALAEEMVRRRVDVIWAVGPEAAIAAARATQTIPIVFWGVASPVEQGLVDSYARPGRNVTGVAFFTGPELSAKLLEILSQVAPGAKRVAAITTPSSTEPVAGERRSRAGSPVESAAQLLGLEFRTHPVRSSDDLDPAFAAILESRAQALLTFGTTLTFRERQRIAGFASRHRLPSVFNQREFVEAGGLVSYGPDTWETVLQSMGYVDRVLRGSRPADLPVERPSKYELVVNLKTARAIDLKIPQSVLLRADRVIE